MMNSEQLERAELNSALFDGENLPENIELNKAAYICFLMCFLMTFPFFDPLGRPNSISE